MTENFGKEDVPELLTKEDVGQWNNFIDELNELQLAYGITLGHGCDCCFDEHTVNGRKVEVPYYKDDPELGMYKIIRLAKIDLDGVFKFD